MDAVRSSVVVVAGATGVVGSRLLRELLAHESVARVVALGRRPPSLRHPKLEVGVVDLGDRGSVARSIPDGVGLAFCCLGTTLRRAGSKEAFRAVDHDAVLAFAAGARDRGVGRFLLVSSVGADSGARSFYLRTKGEVEAAVARVGFSQLTILRPSLIDDGGTRPERRPLERIALPIARALFSIMGRHSRYAPVSADAIASAMVRFAFDETTEALRLIESERLHSS